MKNFAKPNSQLLTANILKYAGHLSTAYDVAYISATAYGDYQEDGEFGEETAKVIASTVASGLAMTGAAAAAATVALPAAGVVVTNIAAGYVVEILKREGLITDSQVGEHIMGERKDAPTNWLVTNIEYGL